ncbi:hypothetical protein GCM10020256_24710 [Streptomyces thermocoprophilus]
MIVSDTGMWSEDTPTVCTGMRGLAECEIRLYGPDQDIHSGSFGGAVPNPATVAARLVAALHDDHARVAIPGFYDGIVELTDRERALFAELPFDEESWLRTAKSYATHGEAGHTTLERIWARPTAEVNGIGGGYQGPGSKTIIPSSAMVKLSFRLVAGQEPDRISKAVRAWAESLVPAGIRSEIAFTGSTRPLPDTPGPPRTPVRGPRHGPRLRTARPLHPRRRLRARRRPPGRPRRPPCCSSASPSPPTAGTRPTRRSSWTCCSKASRPAPTCGATSPGPGAVPADPPPGAQGARRAGAHWKGRPAPARPQPASTGPRPAPAGRRPATAGPRPAPARPHRARAEPPPAPPRSADQTAEPPPKPTVAPGELEAPVTIWTDPTADLNISLTAPSGIDRAAHHRLDEAWLAAAWSHPTTRVFVVSGGQVLIDETPDGRTELVMTPTFEAPSPRPTATSSASTRTAYGTSPSRRTRCPAEWTSPPAPRASARPACCCRRATPA